MRLRKSVNSQEPLFSPSVKCGRQKFLLLFYQSRQAVGDVGTFQLSDNRARKKKGPDSPLTLPPDPHYTKLVLPETPG